MIVIAKCDAGFFRYLGEAIELVKVPFPIVERDAVANFFIEFFGVEASGIRDKWKRANNVFETELMSKSEFVIKTFE